MKKAGLLSLLTLLTGFFGCSRQGNDALFREFVNNQCDTSGTRSYNPEGNIKIIK